MNFDLQSAFSPQGDQPQAIKKLIAGINNSERAQTLLGVTGSGKTFTMANVIAQTNKPSLIISHNKTLAAQLYGEMRSFFPNNAVEYFISYYDYYQPEAYIPSSDTYIDKDLSINEEIEKLRLRATSALMSGRRDVVVVASVSCIYGLGNPEDFKRHMAELRVGQKIERSVLLHKMVEMLYSRSRDDLRRSTFRVKGDTVEVFPAYADHAYRVLFWGDEVEAIMTIDPRTGQKVSDEEGLRIWPANLFVTGRDLVEQALTEIENDMKTQVKFFENDHRFIEAKRVEERTNLDMEMMQELGYCSGIENYSRYFDRRQPGQRAFCLLDYFPDDFLLIIDESHVTLPQVRAMWGGDRSRKINLVEHGFRLPSALDNRPLTFNEFEEIINQVVYVSATPGDYELQQCDGVVTEQLIRPTGLLDPEVDVRPSMDQIDNLLEEVNLRIDRNERVLVTTLTKRMAEELASFFKNLNIKCRYLHSEIDSLERVQILRELRIGKIDVLVGVNLLREGLDLPEVSLVAIMDADKEGFLRDTRSLIQTMGRAARNQNGKVIMYADTVTKSMQAAIDETLRRRAIQADYNAKHNITPQTIRKSTEEIFEQTSTVEKVRGKQYKLPGGNDAKETNNIAAEKNTTYMTVRQLENMIAETKKQMERAAKDLEFIEAARLRDELFELQKLVGEKKEG